MSAENDDVQAGDGIFKKLGIKKQVNKQGNKLLKQAKKEAKKQGKQALKKVAKNVLDKGTEVAVRTAFKGLEYVPGVSVLNDQFNLEDKAVKAAKSGVKKSVGKRVDKKVDGLGMGKGSQAMKDKVAKLRSMKKPNQVDHSKQLALV